MLSGIIMDVTSEKLAEEKLNSLALELREAVATRDEFLSIASHELKTPLTSMRLQNQSMQRSLNKGITSVITPDRIIRMVDNNEKQISRLARLVDDMLDISRIQSGKLTVNIENSDLRSIVSDVYNQLKEQIENAGADSQLILNSKAPGCFDRFRIEQVITNLITNALRYGEGKPISVSLDVMDKMALIKVKDHGMGIAKENFEKIFNRFERITSAAGINGLGLGLYISKEIVLAHSGKIWIESELGKGSTFNVELPLLPC